VHQPVEQQRHAERDHVDDDRGADAEQQRVLHGIPEAAAREHVGVVGEADVVVAVGDSVPVGEAELDRLQRRDDDHCQVHDERGDDEAEHRPSDADLA
jgi:hypothetical protein